ncbi:hypothetical protein ACFE04_017043 [Oxalis oulophora]
MKLTIYLTFLLILILILIISPKFLHAVDSCNKKLINETCQKCSQNDPNLSYTFCLNSLLAAPVKHCTSNLRDLGMISIKLIKSNVTDTKSFIKKTLDKNSKTLDPFVKSCLGDCLELYSDAITNLNDTMNDYKAKRYDDANILVSSVLDAATTCEDGFKEKDGLVSPLTKRNNDTFQLSVISLSIINMLRDLNYAN